YHIYADKTFVILSMHAYGFYLYKLLANGFHGVLLFSTCLTLPVSSSVCNSFFVCFILITFEMSFHFIFFMCVLSFVLGCFLYYFRKGIINVSIQCHLTDKVNRDDFFGPKLRRIENIKVVFEFILHWNQLDT